LGIVAGVVDSTFPEPNILKPKTLLFNKYIVKAVLFKAAGQSESDANANYYYINSKTQTEYVIMIGARFASAASYTAAVATLEAAGVSFTGGLAIFAGTAGLGTPVALVIEVGSASALVAAGVCTLAGAAIADVAGDAENIFKADYSKLSTITNGGPIKAGVKTPKGRSFTEHAAVNANKRGFTPERIDDIIDNWSQKVYQSEGKTVYAKKNGNWYDVVITNKNGDIVTVVGGNTNSLANWSDVTQMLKNNGGYFSLPQL
jgi:hypothetical protein